MLTDVSGLAEEALYLSVPVMLPQKPPIHVMEALTRNVVLATTLKRSGGLISSTTIKLFVLRFTLIIKPSTDYWISSRNRIVVPDARTAGIARRWRTGWSPLTVMRWRTILGCSVIC